MRQYINGMEFIIVYEPQILNKLIKSRISYFMNKNQYSRSLKGFFNTLNVCWNWDGVIIYCQCPWIWTYCVNCRNLLNMKVKFAGKISQRHNSNGMIRWWKARKIHKRNRSSVFSHDVSWFSSLVTDSSNVWDTIGIFSAWLSVGAFCVFVHWTFVCMKSSYWCERLWSRSLFERVKPRPQISQTWGLTSRWMCMCCFKLPWWPKLRPQTLHWNGFSPVWVLSWLL